jgi:adenosylhomocysteine nucleosidase
MVYRALAGAGPGACCLMRLIIVASDPMEFRGITVRTEQKRKSNIGVDWACSARLRGNEVLLAANGVGWKRAAAAVDAAYAVFRADAVVSTGFCGALDPELGIGDIVVATCVIGPEGPYAALPIAGGLRAIKGQMISTDHVIGTAREKQKLHAAGSSAVEMEAAGVALRAQALGLRFYCARAVTDLAAENMANDFGAVLRPDGHFDTIRLIKHVLRRPGARLPELIRLRQNCARAARNLGEFFADCRL